MDLIDLRNVSDLTGIDINMVDTNTLAPEMEPNRQLYFMAKSREYVKRKSEELGRNLTVHITTFGCQMNAKDTLRIIINLIFIIIAWQQFFGKEAEPAGKQIHHAHKQQNIFR